MHLTFVLKNTTKCKKQNKKEKEISEMFLIFNKIKHKAVEKKILKHNSLFLRYVKPSTVK